MACSPIKSPWSGAEDDNRLLSQTQGVEFVEYLAERVVDKAHHAKIRGHNAVEVFYRVAAHPQHLVEYAVALGGAVVVKFVVAPGGKVDVFGRKQGRVLGWAQPGFVWIGKGYPQGKGLVPMLFDKARGLSGDQAGGVVFQWQFGGAVAEAGVLVGELAMLGGDLAATFCRPEPVHAPRLLATTAVGKGVPHVEECQVLLPLEAVVFADQARGVARRFPELPGVCGTGWHRGLVASASVRVGKLRGPE